jgi:hypothetical protein
MTTDLAAEVEVPRARLVGVASLEHGRWKTAHPEFYQGIR